MKLYGSYDEYLDECYERWYDYRQERARQQGDGWNGMKHGIVSLVNLNTHSARELTGNII